MSKPCREVHLLKRGTPLPDGIYLSFDKTPDSDGHYMLCVKEPMPVAEFLAKLHRIADAPRYCRKLSQMEITHATTT